MQQLLPHPGVSPCCHCSQYFPENAKWGGKQPKIPLLNFFFPAAVRPVCFQIRFPHRLTLGTRQGTAPYVGM